MFKFDLKNAEIFKAVKAPIFIRRSDLFRKTFSILSVLSFLFLVSATIQPSLRFIETGRILGVTGFLFFFYLLFLHLNIFFEVGLKKNEPPMKLEDANARIEEINFAEFLNYDAARLLRKAFRSKEKDSTDLLFYIVKSCEFTHFVFTRLLIDKADFLRELQAHKGRDWNDEITDSLKETIVVSLSVAAGRNHKRIRPEDLLVALATSNKPFKQFLIRHDIKKRELKSLTSWYIEINSEINQRKKFWRYENLVKLGTIGKHWAAGGAYFLNKFAVNWTEVVTGRGFRRIIGHEKVVESVERSLSSEQSNVVLVGKPGSGRSAVINELTRKSFLGLTPSEISHKRIYKLQLSSLIANVEGKERTEKILNRIFSEVISAGNIILVLENIHEFIAGDGKVGIVDISGVLETYLKDSRFKFISITNFRDYRRTVERNRAVDSELKKIELSEVSPEEALRLSERVTPSLEEKHNIFVSYRALKSSVELTEKYLPSASFPKKAIDILEEAILHASQKGVEILRKEHITDILSEKAEVPVGKVLGEEKSILLNLEEKIHERIINQEEAVSQISKSLRRSRAELDTRKGLIGSFLFLGPTGVGKTETAKAIADVYFGSEDKMIRIDMSEYQNISDLSRLIGSEDREGVLTEQVVEDPFSLILLDELEKAHRDILNVFLQILDEGHVTDGVGRKVNFKNCMIIATSNAGYKIILNSIKEETTLGEVREDILDHLFQKEIFRPELVNRFDGTVIFEPLSKESLMQIAELQLQGLKESLKEKHIEFKITEELKEKIVDISYEPVFGAREMQRVIQNEIGDNFASAILSDRINAGDEVIVDPDEFKLEKITQ